MAQASRLSCRQFTDTALGFSTGILNALIDLVSFSGILYTIYPPLFLALLIYSVGGTAISLQLGKPLVGLNFRQEAREADFRLGRELVIAWKECINGFRYVKNITENQAIRCSDKRCRHVL